MKTASDALKAHLIGGSMTLAYLWKVKRTDGTILGFTNLDRDITFDDGAGDGPVTYQASTGFANSAAASKSDLSVDNLEVMGFLFDSMSLSEGDLRAGIYDDADIVVRMVNWADLGMGSVVIRRGTLGIVKMVNGKFTAELRGLTHKLTTILGESTGPVCRAEFGSGMNGIDMDSKYLCMVDVTQYQQNGSVFGVTSPRAFIPSGGLLMVGSATPTAPAPAKWFDDGVITFTSGANNGYSFEIKSWDGETLTFFLPLAYAPAPGDTFVIEPGCNKTSGDCKNKFNNIVNMRAELYIPGMDRFLNVPGSGSGLG
jgi:uncharacterized phage protein (TIGR02218 family)